MRMIDLGNQRGPLHIIDTPTSVECGKDVRFRRSFRSLVECMVPCCGFTPAVADSPDSDAESTTHASASASSSTGTVVTGTFFGYRKGRVSFCLHDADSKSSPPLLLLDFAVPTAYLAREMQHGLLRIALECDRSSSRSSSSSSTSSSSSSSSAAPSPSAPLFSVPAWTMYCNGRKVGFAVRRHMNEADAAVFKLMRSVSVGAGVLPGESRSEANGDQLMYLRANFDRVSGSLDSESFHMINPVGSSGQELSIFFLRS